MNVESNDTIVAISTPAGENGIGIVRLSGPLALRVADKLFRAKANSKPSESKSHLIAYGHIIDGNEIIDEVLLSVMHAPMTYTREDIVEINCHGGIVVLKKVLDLVVSLGVRIAAPGEFTKRAFLNGRIDLIQAEAVLDTIKSRTEESLRIAQAQLSGDTSRRIRQIRSSLMNIIADIEAGINFPDEDIDTQRVISLKKALIDQAGELSDMINSSGKGIIFREGIRTVICGKPNVGKSTLMNSFLKQDRVIVTNVPGTTRDTVEEMVNIKGIPLKIVDTAGIIDAEDIVTKESVERSKHHMEIADLILLVLDSSDILSKHDLEIIDIVKDKKTLVIVNKTDLKEVLQVEEIRRHLHDNHITKISAKCKTGIEDLENAICKIFWDGEVSSENIFLSNSRHVEAASRARTFLESAIKGADERRPLELLSVDIKDAISALDLITGEIFEETLLDAIFSNFCIGK